MEKVNLQKLKDQVLAQLKKNSWTDLLFKLSLKLADIIQKDTDSSKFICKICKKHNSSHKPIYLRNLPGHLTSSSHSLHMNKEKMTAIHDEICFIFDPEKHISQKPNDNLSSHESSQVLEEVNSSQTKIKDEVLVKFELTKFIISNRLPFSICNDFLKFIKKLLTDYDHQTLLQASISRKIVTEITKKCIGKTLQETILEDLQQSPFSLMIDKGSDSYGCAFLTVCAKYLQKDNFTQPITRLLSIIELGEKSTAEELYNKIKKKF